MPLLIDGHNLIGAGVLEGISLQDEDDEARLVKRLRVWRSGSRENMTVVFDRGIVGGVSRELSGGGVEVIFARNPREADDLIKRRIHKRAPGLTVVTNDWELRREAKLYDVETWQADEFARRIGAGGARSAPVDAEEVERGAEPDVSLSDSEVAAWMDLFRTPGQAAEGPTPTEGTMPAGGRPTAQSGGAAGNQTKTPRRGKKKKKGRR